jgi:hypothetical protein
MHAGKPIFSQLTDWIHPEQFRRCVQRYVSGQPLGLQFVQGHPIKGSKGAPHYGVRHFGTLPSFCTLADTFSLTPCFSWGLGDVLACQPFQRLSADAKPLKAVARLRPPSSTLLKQGVNESAVNTAVRRRCPLVQKLGSAPTPFRRRINLARRRRRRVITSLIQPPP